MMGTNHILMGVTIGLAVHQPVVAIPLAVASHFVEDAMPHYGDQNITAKRFLIILAIDGTAIAILLATLAIAQPAYWGLAIICGLAAASPDFMWLPNFLRRLYLGLPRKDYTHPIMKFHKNIQWAEKPYNWPYEFLWLAIGLFIVAKLTNLL